VTDSLVSVEAKFSEQAELRLKDLIKRYPNSKSAIMPALYIAQEECGWLTDRAIAWVATRLNLPPSHVVGVATFYTMYYKAPVGKYHIQVCRTLSCMLCGAREIVEYIKKRFNIQANEITHDGMWSYEEVECLGSCGSAPMIEINDVYFENLTIDKLEMLLDRISKEQPDLRYSTVKESLGDAFSDAPKSEVW
jgi:NADH-quinone oxidoreductase subunit E